MRALTKNVNEDPLCGGKYRSLKIRRACQPEDVIWENYGLTPQKRFIRKIITSIIGVILIAIGFTLISIISFFKK